MSQERIQILDMLKEGVITAEEAIRLLDSVAKPVDKEPVKKEEKKATSFSFEKELEEELEEMEKEIEEELEEEMENGFFFEFKDEETAKEFKEKKQRFKEDLKEELKDAYGWVNDFKDTIFKSAKSLSDYVAVQAHAPFDINKEPKHFSAESDAVGEQIKGLKVAGKNSRVEVVGYEGDTIRVDAEYKEKTGMDSRISFEEEEGIYTFNFDSNAVYTMGLRVKVPQKYIENLKVNNSNAELIMRRLDFERAEATTKNAAMYLDSLTGKSLQVEDKNGTVNLMDIKAMEMMVKTANAPAVLNNVDGDYVRVYTSNASININAVDIRQVDMKTSNAGIYYSTLGKILESDKNLYTVDAQTSNGKITLEIPQIQDVACRLRASTSVGAVHADLKDFYSYSNEKNYVDGKSEGYEDAEKKINLSLQNSNGSIVVR